MLNDTLNTTAIERAAYECETCAQAAEHLGIEVAALRTSLERRPDVQTAWDRGRLLRKVRDLAAVTVTVWQAAKELGMDGPAFRQLLDTDAEVAAVWDQARRRLRRTAAEAVIRNAERGSRSAGRYVENFLRSEQKGPGMSFDFERVPIEIMTSILGKTRQTLWSWTRDSGCPRNPDCTYNVAEVFRWIQSRTALKQPSVAVADQVRRAIRTELQPLVTALAATPAIGQEKGTDGDTDSRS